MSVEDLHNYTPAHSRRRGGCRPLLALGLVGLLVACVLGGIGVQRTLAAMPNLNIAVGPFSLEAEISYSQHCPPHRPCRISADFGIDYYNVWVFFSPPPSENGWRLFTQQVAP